MSSKLSHEAQAILGLVQELRLEDESFCFQYPEISNFFDAYEALEILRVRYPHFQSEAVEALIKAVDIQLIKLILRN